VGQSTAKQHQLAEYPNDLKKNLPREDGLAFRIADNIACVKITGALSD
jgi:hypothetical protein